jgi:hypothetical protein
MPNLLPDWTLTLPWDLGDWSLRASGRLVWAIFLFAVGVAVVFALMRPPHLQRPFSTTVGIVLFPVIIIGTMVVAKILPEAQRTIVWLGIFVLLAHLFLMLASRKPRDPDQAATWSECIAGAVGVFALMALGYAVIPSEWLTFANANLEWGDNSKFVFESNEKILGFIPVNYPFSLNYPALRDIVVTLIYVVVLGLNIFMIAKWQKRNEVAAEPAEGEPEKKSRFGRPLRSMRRRGAPAPSTASASAAGPMPEGAN